MTLIERIENLHQRAYALRSLEEKRAESRRLQPLLTDARKLSEELGSEIIQLRLLQDQGVGASGPTTAATARKTLSTLRERFTKELRGEDLTRGKDWTRLKEQVRETCKNLSSSLDIEWRNVVEAAYSGDTPSNLEHSIGSTPGNLQALRRYRDAYSKLRQYARSRPKERADFDHLRDLARELTEIYQGFDFDVPEDVKHFLQAVADGGADLGFLTAEVRDWLQQEGTSGHYRIIAKVYSE